LVNYEKLLRAPWAHFLDKNREKPAIPLKSCNFPWSLEKNIQIGSKPSQLKPQKPILYEQSDRKTKQATAIIRNSLPEK
jgi:hypothetical protein